MSAPCTRRMLYVEDDEALGKSMVRELGHLLPEAPVHWVKTEREAVAVLVSDEPLLVAMVDVDLGVGGDGLAAIERTRDLRPDLPVLVVTGLEEPRHEHRGLALRAMFVHKPIGACEVAALVRHYLDRPEDVRLAPFRRVAGGLALELDLTAMEVEALVGALDGRTRKESADRLDKSEESIKDARRRVARKASEVLGIETFDGVLDLLRSRI